MRNTYYKKFSDSVSNNFYGVDATVGQAALALLLILALLLVSGLNASSLVSLLFVIIKQQSSGILFYLSAISITGLVFGAFWNLVTLFGKRITSMKVLAQPHFLGTIIISYLILIIASFGLVFKINYADGVKNLEYLVLAFNNKSKNDLYLFFSILASQVLLIAYILIQRRLVIDSVTARLIEKKANRYERKAKEYDLVYDHYFVELISSQNDNSTRKYTALLTDSNKKTISLDWDSNTKKSAEEEFLENIENSESELYKTLEGIRNIDREKARELQVRIFAGISHELGNKIPFVHGDLEQLVKYLKRKHFTILSEGLKDITNSEKIEDLLSRMNNSLDYSKKMLAGMGKILKCDPSKMHRQKININQFIAKVFESQKFQNGQVSLLIDNDCCQELYVEEIQFRLFLESIFENANRHAFIDIKNYSIVFNITIDHVNIYIDIYNDGVPLSDQFTIEDFITPSKYLGETGNTGLGGYLINLVINNHGGKLISIANTEDKLGKGVVLFKLQLPIKLNIYEY